MRILGGILCWIMPDKIIQEVASEDRLSNDLISNLIATTIFCFLGWRLISVFTGVAHHSSNIILEIFVAPLGVFIVNLIIMAALTWALTYMFSLNKIEVNGQLLQPGFNELFSYHLHAWAFFLTSIFIGMVTRNPQFFIIMSLVILRTIDLEARIIKNVCDIDIKDAYKIIAAITGIIISGILISYIFIRILG